MNKIKNSPAEEPPVDHSPDFIISPPVREHDENPLATDGRTAPHAGEEQPQQSLPDSRPRVSFFARLRQSIATIIVVGALAGVGYFGHHTGWKIPKFSELNGKGETDDIEWCEEHGVPEAECIACNADLFPKGQLFGWCEKHGVHECVLDHPELAQLAETPIVTQEDFERASRAIAIHPRPRNDPGCKMHLRRIQFPSIAAADKVGIDIGLVDRGRVVESIRANGEVRYDPTLVARLASRTAGTVWHVAKNVGDPVRQGDVLALIDSAEVGRAKAELLQAVAKWHFANQTQRRLSGLGSVVAGKRLLEAETALNEAGAAVQKAVQKLDNLGLFIALDDAKKLPSADLEQKVRYLGIPDRYLSGRDSLRFTSNLLPLIAPRDGLVANRDVVVGEVVDTTRTLFTIADTRRMWLILDVPMEEMRFVSIGQQTVFRADGSDREDRGHLTWISTEVDRETRTVQVRAELKNDDGHLRNESFGSGEVILREEKDAILVPSSAVHWEGCCHVVFVRDKSWFSSPYKVFHTRSVRPGVVQGDQTEIIAGLLPGEVVVTKGSGVLRAELLKGNLGAG